MQATQSNLPSKGRQGFTLIELLVVIAIIAIVAAILFPVFARARAQARKTVGISNMRQIGTGTMMYVQDYDERFPAYFWDQMQCTELGITGHPDQKSYKDPAYANYVQSPWCNAIMPYVKNVGVFQDPSDRTQQQPWLCVYFPPSVYALGVDPGKVSTWISYGWNESASAQPLAAYQNPASDLMWADSSGLMLIDTWGRFGWTDDLYVRRAIWNDLDWGSHCGLSPDPRAAAVSASAFLPQWECLRRYTRHETHSNIAFMDGHTKLLPTRTLREVGPDNGQVVPGPGSVTPRF